MHSGMPDHDGKKPSRREVLMARVRRMLRRMRDQFLLGLAYTSGSACVSVAVWWAQHRL